MNTLKNNIISPDVIVFVHRLLIDGKRKLGGLDRLIQSISEKKQVFLVEHPLKGLKESRDQKWSEAVISEIKKDDYRKLAIKKLLPLPSVFYWFQEIIFNLYFVARNIKNKPVLISADPLSNLVGLLLPWRFRRKYYHCIDYSPQRFSNPFFRFFYFMFLRWTFWKFDYIAVNSSRTHQVFISLGCPVSKLILAPNAPFFKRYDVTKKEKFSLICSGGTIIPKYNYDLILDILAGIKKKYPHFRLYAVGGKNQDPEYFSHLKTKIKKYGLENNIFFTGFLEPKKILLLYQKVSLGFSFYSRDVSYYMYYGDSLKIREYALFGIPMMSDGICATDFEMEKAGSGIIVHSVGEAVNFIDKCWLNDKYYRQLQQACLKWAEKNDKRKTQESLYNKLFSN